MFDYPEIRYGIQTIFSTIPTQDIEFEKAVEQNYFEDYRNEIGIPANDPLYKPLKFYMLGDYDVCYISLINNFKFSHRLFEPKNENDKDIVYHPHTFQSFAGFGLNNKEALEKIFTQKNENHFVGVINLKINNGLLIGNGLDLIGAVCRHIESRLGSTPCIITHTFSWFELSLAVFINDTQELADILVDLRLSEFKDLDNWRDLESSLYHHYFKQEMDKIKTSSLFADTHTYFGFNNNLIEKGPADPTVLSFIETAKEKKIRLKTEVEWQVKPGHITEVEKIIRKHKDLKDYFNLEQTKLVLGKCDYMLQESTEDILANFYLVRYLHNFKKCKILKHVRKVRSYIFLEASEAVKNNPNAASDKSEPLSWNDKLKKLAVTSKDFFNVDCRLKALKVSRQVRIKILKIFSNYNNGIQDPILFPLFLDFTIFIRNLIELTDIEFKESQHHSFKLRDLEKKLNEHIKVFQEGYAVRFLNGYQFENISDFDLDFNSSIQQLLTSYGSLVYEYGRLFYDDNTYAPIIALNDTDTISNNLSINYSTHHLTSPEFVFTTLLKEVLNQYDAHNDVLKGLLASFYKDIHSVKDRINESYLDDMLDNKLVDLNYFIIDSIRFTVTFNSNFTLFSHWFWAYNFQNSSLFDTGGMFNEDQMCMEMLRILMVHKLYKVSQPAECPVPELFTYWDRHYDKIEHIADSLIKCIEEKEITSFIEQIINKYLDGYKEYNEPFDSRLVEGTSQASFVDIYSLLNKISYMYSDLAASPRESIHHMERLMFRALNHQFEENGRKITLLKRDWVKGTALANHKNLYSDMIYAIDQTGGVYFNNIEKMNAYFNFNASCLLEIIHFSYLSKKEFIITNSRA